MGFTVAIGDIHGMSGKLERLLARIDEWLQSASQRRLPSSDAPAKLVFLGDYVDRGPDSKGVLDRLRRLQRSGAICLRGNHEELMIRSSLSETGARNFLLNGGDATVRSLGSGPGFQQAQEWMQTLPSWYEDDLRYFVHAGIDPDVPLELQDDGSRLWIREKFLRFRGPLPKYVVHGHTPTLALEADRTAPEVADNRCNLDTGACYGGPLSAAVFDDLSVQPLRLISVM